MKVVVTLFGSGFNTTPTVASFSTVLASGDATLTLRNFHNRIDVTGHIGQGSKFHGCRHQPS